MSTRTLRTESDLITWRAYVEGQGCSFDETPTPDTYPCVVVWYFEDRYERGDRDKILFKFIYARDFDTVQVTGGK